jgi:DnaJ-class molecular chaperone
MTELITKIKCSRCLGTGIDNNVIPTVPCQPCSGTGYVQSETTNISVITDELDWIKNKIKKILKKLDLPED